MLIPPISGRVGLPARQHPCHIKPEHAKMTAAAGKIATVNVMGRKPKRGSKPSKAQFDLHVSGRGLAAGDIRDDER